MPSFTTQGAPIDVRKFQFSDFEDENAIVIGAEPPEPEPTFSLTDLEAAKAVAEQQGHQKGVEESAASFEADMARTLEAISASAALMTAERRRQEDFISVEAVRLAATIARCVLPVVAHTHALAEIEGLLAVCLKERSEEPRLVIRLPDELLDPVSSRMAKLTQEAGFTGKPILLADPSLKRTQARVEWSNGGADWNFDAMLNALEAAAHSLGSVKRPAAARKPEIEADNEPATKEM